MKKQFAVIGLGRFGGSLTRTLVSLGHEVLAIDVNKHTVEQFSTIATEAIQIDATDELALKRIGIRNFEHVVVAIGDIQSNILTTLIVKDLGIEHVIVKATNEYHRKVLEKIGAEQIIQPEREMGVRLAHHVVSENVIDYIELTADYSLVEVIATEEMDGKTLEKLGIRAKYGCNVMAIKTKDDEMNISPKADDKIYKGDILIVVGSSDDIKQFEDSL